MKLIAVLLVAALGAAVYAQDEPQEPKALVKAREAYQKEVKRALQPVNQDYLDRLETLKKQLGVAGDTAGMVAVQKEIDTLKDQTAKPAELKKDWIEGKWEYNAEGSVWCREYRDSICRFTNKEHNTLIGEYPYEIISSKLVRVTYPGGKVGEHKWVRVGVLDIEGRWTARKAKDTPAKE